MRIERCKGCRDLSPEQMVNFRLIEGVFLNCCLKWGYQEVRTPTLEYLHLFTATGTLTPGMLGKVYSFLDWDGWSGQRVVLRPDATIPVARLYIESRQERDVAKLCYVANSFIFEETGSENRERWQCGAELVGSNSTLANVELISLALEVLRKLGLEGVRVRLSHAGVIKALLSKLELSPGEQNKVFDRLLDGDATVLADLRPGKPELVKMMRLLLDMKGKSSGFLKNIKALIGDSLPELEPPLDDFIGTCDLLEELGFSYQVDLASGRGFEYYTGMIFHLFVGDDNIGGGGRYDALIPLMGGKETAAAGFALYIDRLMNLIEPKEPLKSRVGKVLVRVKPQMAREAFAIARSLRDAGLVAEFSLDDEGADGCGWTLDVGGKEAKFVLTDLGRRQRFTAASPAEVLKILGVEDVAEDSTA